jgi:hypothetical protein
MFLFVYSLCLSGPSLNIILHLWNFCSNDVNYFSDIKKMFLLMLLFEPIIEGHKETFIKKQKPLWGGGGDQANIFKYLKNFGFSLLIFALG